MNFLGLTITVNNIVVTFFVVLISSIVKLSEPSENTFRVGRRLQQFNNDDLGFNLAPQVDFLRDFTRANLPGFQSFPSPPRSPLQPNDDAPDYSDIESFREIGPVDGSSEGFPQGPPSSNFQPSPVNNGQNVRNSGTFQRVRIPQPPPRSPALDLPSIAFANNGGPPQSPPSSGASGSPSSGPRFQRINVRNRPVASVPIPPPITSSSGPPATPNTPFRRLPVFRNPDQDSPARRPSVVLSTEDDLVPGGSPVLGQPLPPALGTEFAVPPVTSAPLPQPPQTQPPRTRRVRPTTGGSRRIRPANGNRIRSRVPSDVSPIVAPTAVIVPRPPPATPVPIGTEVATDDLERNQDTRRIRGRRPVAGVSPVPPPNRSTSGSSPLRVRPVSGNNVDNLPTDEEVINNNALDSGDSVESGFGSKLKDDVVSFSAGVPSPNGPVVVDYMTTFTYLTTVIRGPHTLLTSRESVTSVRVTQPYDPSIAEIISASGGNIR